MNTILLRSPKIVILRILDKYLEILEDCMDFNHNNSSLSQLTMNTGAMVPMR